jgi:GTP-binding protein
VREPKAGAPPKAPAPTPAIATGVNENDALDLEKGRLLFLQEPRFELGVPTMNVLPPAGAPEIAFAGRSNVGKSSLVNGLVERRHLARASGEPGRTRELNFFLLGPEEAPRVRLVDMPGYGYAKASKTEIERWNILIRQYLRGRTPLKRVILLIDSRHGIKPNDLQVMDGFDQTAVAYQIVLTKADKLKASERDAVLADTKAKIARRPAAHPRVILVSAQEGWGLPELRAEIAALALG